MPTCHRCSAPFRDPSKMFSCGDCGLNAHNYDCAGKLTAVGLGAEHANSCPKCDMLCLCIVQGGVKCHAGLRIERRRAGADAAAPPRKKMKSAPLPLALPLSPAPSASLAGDDDQNGLAHDIEAVLVAHGDKSPRARASAAEAARVCVRTFASMVGAETPVAAAAQAEAPMAEQLWATDAWCVDDDFVDGMPVV